VGQRYFSAESLAKLTLTGSYLSASTSDRGMGNHQSPHVSH